MSADSVIPFMMAVEDFDLPAIEAAAKAFIKGEVPGHVPSFAPSAPELANECRRQQDRIKWEEHRASHEFIVEGSDLWRQVEQMQGASLPVREISVDGVKMRGWDVQKETAAKAKMIELPKPGSKVVPIPSMKGIG